MTMQSNIKTISLMRNDSWRGFILCVYTENMVGFSSLIDLQLIFSISVPDLLFPSSVTKSLSQSSFDLCYEHVNHAALSGYHGSWISVANDKMKVPRRFFCIFSWHDAKGMEQACAEQCSNIHLPPIDGGVYDLTMKYGCLIRERVRKFIFVRLPLNIYVL
jgi:hypothetical protein